MTRMMPLWTDICTKIFFRSIVRKKEIFYMKTIAIIATGGTIAGQGQLGKSASYSAGQLDVKDIVTSIPQIEELAHIQTIQLYNVDSNDMGFEKWKELRKVCTQLEHDDSIDGIVITHGTDTLEETAFFLNLTLPCEKPVVLTGSMRPASATSADGPMNLYQAVALACHDEAKKAGVLAVFSDTIYSGRDLQKTNSYKTDAFKMGEFGSLGYMRDDHVYLLNAPHKKHTYQTIFSKLNLDTLPRVGIYYCHCDNEIDHLKWMLEHYDGVVIAGTGSGNYSNEIKEVIESSTDCVIVRSSRVLEGAVFDSAYFDPNKKTIPALKFSAQKARILLQLALVYSQDELMIRDLFFEY